MKKIVLLVAAITSTMIIACGPSAEEIAAKEKAKQDSIQKVEEERMMKEAEEMAAKAKEDSIAQAQAIQDSIVKAEEEAAAKKSKSASKPKKKADVKPEGPTRTSATKEGTDNSKPVRGQATKVK
jgi:hypothetical protein